MNTIQVPKKLKHDAIVEAVFEIRFNRPNTSIPEIFLGRIADHDPWRTFNQHRLPASQLPALLRQADQNLRYQPVIELVPNGKDIAVRVGPDVLSYHRLSPYVGWERFKPELEEAIGGCSRRRPAWISTGWAALHERSTASDPWDQCPQRSQHKH